MRVELAPSTRGKPPPHAERRSSLLLELKRLLPRWTRTQRIRTAGAIPVEAVIVDQVETPLYLKLADKAKHLRELGLSDKAIARALGISDKTLAKDDVSRLVRRPAVKVVGPPRRTA